MTCPHCRGSDRLVEYRTRSAQGLVASLPLDRAHHHRRPCGVGTAPWDETLGLSRRAMTPGAKELARLAGVIDGLGEDADIVLKELAALQVSRSTVEQAGEATGRDIGRRVGAGETSGPADLGLGFKTPR